MLINHYHRILLSGGVILLALTSCGMDQAAEQGSMAAQEAYGRGYMGFIHCERQRSLARLGFPWDPRACPPVGSTPQERR